MTKKDSTKRHIEAVFAAAARKRAQLATRNVKLSLNERLASQVTTVEPIVSAFDKAGLNVEDPADWITLAALFAAAVYGKAAGRPPTWSVEKYDTLLNDIARIELSARTGSEIGRCEALLRTHNGTYNGVTNPRTLRRILQDAKQFKTTWDKFSRYSQDEGLTVIDFLKREQKRRRLNTRRT